MNQEKYIFSQITGFLNRSKFRHIVAPHEHGILQFSRICYLTSRMHLQDLLDKTNFQNEKDRSDSSEPLLFNF